MSNGGEIDLGQSDLPEQIESQTDALTIPWLAKKLSCSPQLLYRMAERGQLPSLRIGSLIRLSPAATAEWLRTRQCGTIRKTSFAARGRSGHATSQAQEILMPRPTATLRQKSHRANLSAGGDHGD